MKKKLCILIVLCIFLFTGCSRKIDIKDYFALPMTVSASLLNSEGVFTAIIDENGCEISFSENHALNGTVLILREDKIGVSFGDDLDFEVIRGTFPAQESLCRAARLLCSASEKGIFEENRVKYTIDEMTIMVYYDSNSEKITYIETEENGRRFKFAVTGLQINETQSDSTGQP